MDQQVTGPNYIWPFAHWGSGNRWPDLFFHAQVHTGRVSTHPAGAFFAFRPCAAVGARLPLLPRWGGEVVVLERADGGHLYELPQRGPGQ